METLTIYWESEIKIYGIGIQAGAALARVLVPAASAGSWAATLRRIEDADGRFLMTVAQAPDPEHVELLLAIEPNHLETCLRHLHTAAASDPEISIAVESPVDLLHFHGPHFGDRYGIADAAFGVLAKKGMPVLAAGCTGACLTIALPGQCAGEAVRHLSEKFVVPDSS